MTISETKPTTDSTPEPYPQHVRLRAVRDEMGRMQRFLEWIEEGNTYSICERREPESDSSKYLDSLVPNEDSKTYERMGDGFIQALELIADRACIYWPTYTRHEDILYEYFKIDKRKLEDERVAMLDTLRNAPVPELPPLKPIQVWTEGHSATGSGSPAHYWGTFSAKSLKDASFKCAEGSPLFKKLFNAQEMTYWGCNIFDNETDARKTFG